MQYINNFAESRFNGYAVKEWLQENGDISIYISIAYLAFVFKGPMLVRWMFKGKPPVVLTKKIWMLWNFALSLFSLWGSSIITPYYLKEIRSKSIGDVICGSDDHLMYENIIGFAMCAFAISKLPEFGDTFFLIFTGKQSLPFISWFHHVTIFIYCWYYYSQGSNIPFVLAAMNYPVHTIMYFYFALAEAGYKRLVKPFAMYITLLQIAQMIAGLYFTYYSMILHDDNYKFCVKQKKSVSRSLFAIYVANFYMFSEMFIRGYILPRKTNNSKAE